MNEKTRESEAGKDTRGSAVDKETMEATAGMDIMGTVAVVETRGIADVT